MFNDELDKTSLANKLSKISQLFPSYLMPNLKSLTQTEYSSPWLSKQVKFGIKRDKKTCFQLPLKESCLSRTLKVKRKKAFDLLDANSQSRTLPLESSELHVVIGMAVCSHKSLMATIIEDSTKVERFFVVLVWIAFNLSVNALLGGDRTKVDRLLSTFLSLVELWVNHLCNYELNDHSPTAIKIEGMKNYLSCCEN